MEPDPNFQYSQLYISIDQTKVILGLKSHRDILTTLSRAKIEHFKHLSPWIEECGLQTKRWVYKVNRLQLLSFLARYEEVVYE